MVIKEDFTIAAPRVALRLPEVSLADSYVTAVRESLPEISLWLPWAQAVPTQNQALEYIKLCRANWMVVNPVKSNLTLWVYDRCNGEFLGSIVIWNVVWDVPKVELGFWLRTTQVGRGYISEAVNALSRYLFEVVLVNRIEIRCEGENLKAQQVPRRLNFELDGRLKKSTLAVANGKLTDTILFSCTEVTSLPHIVVEW